MVTESSPSPRRNHRALVVEQNRSVCTLIRALLNRDEYDVEVASNAADATNKLAIGNYALVIMNLTVPQADPFKVLRQLELSTGRGARWRMAQRPFGLEQVVAFTCEAEARYAAPARPFVEGAPRR